MREDEYEVELGTSIEPMNGLIEDHRSDLRIDRMVGQAVEWTSLKRGRQAVRKQQKESSGWEEATQLAGVYGTWNAFVRLAGRDKRTVVDCKPLQGREWPIVFLSHFWPLHEEESR